MGVGEGRHDNPYTTDLPNDIRSVDGIHGGATQCCMLLLKVFHKCLVLVIMDRKKVVNGKVKRRQCVVYVEHGNGMYLSVHEFCSSLTNLVQNNKHLFERGVVDFLPIFCLCAQKLTCLKQSNKEHKVAVTVFGWLVVFLR